MSKTKSLLEELGVEINAIDFTVMNDREVPRASHQIDAKAILLSIPREALLDADNSGVRSVLSDEEWSNLNDWTRLMLSLLLRKQRSPHYSQYIDSMQRDFDTLMFWDADELAELQASTIRQKIGKEQAEALYKDTIAPIMNKYPERFYSGIEAFHGVGSIIMAHSIDLPRLPATSEDSDDDDEDLTVKAICPLLDQMTSSVDEYNVDIKIQPAGIELIASKDIKAGDRLILSADPVPSVELLRRLGTICEDNPHESVEIEGNLVTAYSDPTSPSTEHATHKLEKEDWCLDMEILDDYFEIPLSSIVPKEVLQVLKVMKMPYSDFKLLRDSGEDHVKAEKSAWMKEAVTTVLRSKLQQYGTSIDQDETILKTSQGRLRSAVHVRIQEKKILTAAIERVQQWHIEEGHTSKRQKIR